MGEFWNRDTQFVKSSFFEICGCQSNVNITKHRDFCFPRVQQFGRTKFKPRNKVIPFSCCIDNNSNSRIRACVIQNATTHSLRLIPRRKLIILICSNELINQIIIRVFYSLQSLISHRQRDFAVLRYGIRTQKWKISVKLYYPICRVLHSVRTRTIEKNE